MVKSWVVGFRVPSKNVPIMIERIENDLPPSHRLGPLVARDERISPLYPRNLGICFPSHDSYFGE